MPTYDRYEKWQKYVNGLPTNEFRKGALLGDDEEYNSLAECEVHTLYKWEESTDWYCINYSSYYKEYQYKSNDKGLTWTKTGEFRMGSLKEQYATECGWELKEEWQKTDTVVTGVDEVWALRRSWDMGKTWEDTGDYKYYRWTDDLDQYECDNYTSYYIAYWMESNVFGYISKWPDPDTEIEWYRAAPIKYKRGSMKELHSRDCGWILMAEWVDTGETTCHGYVKAKVFRKRISYDMGETWEWTDDYLYQDGDYDEDCILSGEPLTYSITLHNPLTTIQVLTTKDASKSPLWIDWGYGAGIQNYSEAEGNFRYTYTNPGTYTIKFYGPVRTIGSIIPITEANENDTYSIVSWGTAVGLQNATIDTSYFDDEFPPESFYSNVGTEAKIPNLVDLDTANDLTLANLTANHADALLYVVDFTCEGNTKDLAGVGLPSGMFNYADSMRWSIFAGCGLTSVPANFYANTKQVNYVSTFEDCTELLTIGEHCIGPNTEGIPYVLNQSGEGSSSLRTVQIAYEPNDCSIVLWSDLPDGENAVVLHQYDNPFLYDYSVSDWASYASMPMPFATVAYALVGNHGVSYQLPNKSDYYFAMQDWQVNDADSSNNSFTIWRNKPDLIFCLRTFYNCSKLNNISSDPINRRIKFACANQMFAKCTALKNVPSILYTFTPENNEGCLRYSGDIPEGFYLNNTYGGVFDGEVNIFDGRAMFMNSGIEGELVVSATDGGKDNQFYDLTNIFRGCNNLTKVTWTSNFVERPLNNIKILSAQYTPFALAFCENLEEVSISGVSWPEFMCAYDKKLHTAYINVYTAERMFKECTTLVNVTGHIMLSADATFEHCTSLTNIPYDVIEDCEITNSTFFKCYGLTTIDPSRKFGKYPYLTFLGCTNLDVSNYDVWSKYPSVNDTQTQFPGLRSTLAFQECKNVDNIPNTFGGNTVPGSEYPDYSSKIAYAAIINKDDNKKETLMTDSELSDLKAKSVRYGEECLYNWISKRMSTNYINGYSTVYDRLYNINFKILINGSINDIPSSSITSVYYSGWMDYPSNSNSVKYGLFRINDLSLNNNPSAPQIELTPNALNDLLYLDEYASRANTLVTRGHLRSVETVNEQFNNEVGYYGAGDSANNSYRNYNNYISYINNNTVREILEKTSLSSWNIYYYRYFIRAFAYCPNLTALPTDLDLWGALKAKGCGFDSMFYKCINLTTIPHLWNLSDYYTPAEDDYYSIFNNCEDGMFTNIGALSEEEKSLITSELKAVYGSIQVVNYSNTTKEGWKWAADIWGFTGNNALY